MAESGEKKLPVAVISDGKPGHENQSLGIAERLPNSDVIILKHKLKESPQELLIRIQTIWSPRSRLNTIRLLRRIFPEDDIIRLVDHKPKAIISAGTLSAAPCLLAGRLTGAPTCVCMMPSLVPLSKFGLAVIPVHDNPPNAANVLRTIAAPNRVCSKLLDSEWSLWMDEFPKNEKPAISWVIGGPSSSANFNEDHVLHALNWSVDWADRAEWQIWLSTSRRTPETLEEKIAALKDKHQSLSWALLWHRDQRNPLYAMFAKSKIAVVTSDSVSMISEAASAGVGPIVYNAAGDGESRTKQDIMVNRLLEAGYGIRAKSADQLVLILRDIAKENKTFPILDDTGRAAERLMTLIRL